MIKIGVDGRLLQGNLTGVGKYVLNLIDFICEQDEAIFFSIYSNKEITCKFKSNHVQIILDAGFATRIKPMVWSKLLSFRIINPDAPDIFLAGDAFVPLFIKPKKIISVVHDLNTIVVPETLGRLKLISAKLFFKQDLQKADIVISNSNGTAAKLKKFYNRKTDLVIYPIIDNWYKILDKESVKVKLTELSVNYPYILTVATQEPRKNLEKTINAFAKLKNQNQLGGFKLLLIGSKGWKSQNVEDLLVKHSADVLSLGYIADDVMPYLYNGAELFVFPSSYEGFGMPALEALLCGIPVITTNIEELKEATYNKAIYINPNDEDQFTRSIIETINNKKIKNDIKSISFKKNDQLSMLMPAIYN